MEAYCQLCSRQFDTLESLRQHNLSKHAGEEKGLEPADGAEAVKRAAEVGTGADDAFSLVAGILALLALASAWIAFGMKRA